MTDSDSLSLKAENDNLRDELTKVRADKDFIWTLWKRLQVSSPDITEAVSLVVKREREKADKNDERVLQILKAKDAKLDNLSLVTSQQSSEITSLVKQKTDLLQKVNRLEAEVVSLHDRNRHLETKAANYEHAEEVYEQQVRGAVARYEKETVDLRSRVSSLQLEVSTLRQALSDTKVKAQSFEDELRETRLRADGAKDYRRKVEEQAELMRQIQELQENTQRMLEQQTETHRAESDNLQSELNHYRECCAELESQLTKPSPSLDEPVLDYPYKIKQLQKTISHLKDKVKTPVKTKPVCQALVELQSQINSLQKKLDASESSSSLKDEEIKKLKLSLEKKKGRVQTLQESLKRSRQVESHKTEELVSENSRLRADNTVLEKELHSLKGQVAQQADSLYQLRKALDQERKDLIEARENPPPRGEDLRVLTEELDSARNKIMDLDEMVDELSRELDGQQQACRSWSHEKRDLVTQLKVARRDLKQKNQALIHMKKYLHSLSEKISLLQEEAVARDREEWSDVEKVVLDSDRSLGQQIAASADVDHSLSETLSIISQDLDHVKSDPCLLNTKKPRLSLLSSRIGSLQQQLIAVKNSRVKAVTAYNQCKKDLERAQNDLKQSQSRSQRLKETCDRLSLEVEAARKSQGVTFDPIPIYQTDSGLDFSDREPTSQDSTPRLPNQSEIRGIEVRARAVSTELVRQSRLATQFRQEKEALEKINKELKEKSLKLEREATAKKTLVEELRARVKAATDSATADKEVQDSKDKKLAEVQSFADRARVQIESLKTQLQIATEQKKKYEEQWLDCKSQLDRHANRARDALAQQAASERQASVTTEKLRRQAEDSIARSSVAVDAAREQLAVATGRLSSAERFFTQLCRALESKMDLVRFVADNYLKLSEKKQKQQQPSLSESRHLSSAKETAASILNLPLSEIDALMDDSRGRDRSVAPRLAGFVSSKELDKQWVNRCIKLVHSIHMDSDSFQADLLVDTFVEKLDELVDVFKTVCAL